MTIRLFDGYRNSYTSRTCQLSKYIMDHFAIHPDPVRSLKLSLDGVSSIKLNTYLNVLSFLIRIYKQGKCPS